MSEQEQSLRDLILELVPAEPGETIGNKLKEDIRAELDDSLLERFHGTKSLPFEAGDNRRIAVKIVDDHGIESLKVIDLD